MSLDAEPGCGPIVLTRTDGRRLAVAASDLSTAEEFPEGYAMGMAATPCGFTRLTLRAPRHYSHLDVRESLDAILVAWKRALAEGREWSLP